LIPVLIITPLVFLGGSFYSVTNGLPRSGQTISLFQTVVYLISASAAFLTTADVARRRLSLLAISLFRCALS